MPFQSESQRRACHAANDPNWDCEKWEEHTKGKLPKKKKGSSMGGPLRLIKSGDTHEQLHGYNCGCEVMHAKRHTNAKTPIDGTEIQTEKTGDKFKTLIRDMDNGHSSLVAKFGAGPFIGPRGGKWADPHHKIPWHEGSFSQRLMSKLRRRRPGHGGSVQLSKDELRVVLTSGKYALVSAGPNPNVAMDQDMTPARAKERHTELRRKLVQGGYTFTGVEGYYGGREDSFLVMIHDADRSDVRSFGSRFNQDSVIYAKAGKNELHFTHGPNAEAGLCAEGAGWTEVNKASDMYTKFPHPNGSSTKFALHFDFDNLKPCHKSEQGPLSLIKGEGTFLIPLIDDELVKANADTHLVHEIFEDATPGYPVVTHVFTGKTREEAQGYFESHMETDDFMRAMERSGKFKDISGKTKKRWLTGKLPIEVQKAVLDTTLRKARATRSTPHLLKAKYTSRKKVRGKWQYTYKEPAAVKHHGVEEDVDAYVTRVIAEQKAFESHIDKELESKGSLLLPNKHGENDWISVTRSTYPGVKWQITRWEGNPLEPKSEPTGHTDIKGGTKDVTKELRYWVDTKKAAEPMHAKRRDGGGPQIYGEQSMPDYGEIYGTEHGLRKISREQMAQATLRRRADAARMVHQFGFHGEALEPMRLYAPEDFIPHQETFQGKNPPTKHNREENNRAQVKRLTIKARPKYIPPEKRDPNYRTP